MGRMLRPLAVLLWLPLGCSFSGAAGGDGGPRPDARPDAPPPDAALVDADPVCDPISVRLLVNDEEWSEGDAPRALFPGDSVLFNAATSCSPDGNLDFTWDLGGGAFVARGGAATGPIIEVYPDASGPLTLTLTLSSGGDEAVAEIDFAVGGFALLELAATTAVHRMVAGDGELWMATESGAFTATLADLDNGGLDYPAVNSIPDTPAATIPSPVHHVSYDPTGDVVSFAADAGDTGFFFDRGTPDITEAVIVDPEAEGETIAGLGPLAGGGLRVVTSGGTRTTTDYAAFDVEHAQTGLEVIRPQGAELLGGGDQLYQLAEPIAPRNIFDDDPEPLDGIRALFVDAGGQLWIGSDSGSADHGVAIIEDFADASIDTELLGTSIRHIAQDATGDMWVATGGGVARYKADWQEWVILDTDHGLTEIDVASLIVDEAGGRRAILVGTASGLFVLR